MAVNYSLAYNVEDCTLTGSIDLNDGLDRSDYQYWLDIRYVNDDGSYTDIDFEWDELTSVNFNIPVQDGVIQILVRVQTIGQIGFDVETAEFYVTCDIDDCLEEAKEKWCLEECLDNEDSDAYFDKYLKLKHIKIAVDESVQDEDYKLAKCLVESATALCEGKDKDCGDC